MAQDDASPDKATRLFTLVILLSSGSVPRTRAEIFEKMATFYQGSADARERMFERDKKALREIGIDLQTFEHPDSGDLLGYRIDVSQSQEHRVSFSPEESVVVSIAARLLADAADSQDIAKAALGVDALAGGSAVDWLSEVLRPVPLPPVVHELASAIGERQRVEFTYAKPGHAATLRVVHPWMVVARTGRWYLAAEDVSTGSAKVFRVDRIVGSVFADPTLNSFTVPADLNISDLLNGPGQETEAAQLLVRPGTGVRLRRLSVTTETFNEEWDRCTLPDMNEERLARLIAEHAPDVQVLSPEPLVVRVNSMWAKAGTLNAS